MYNAQFVAENGQKFNFGYEFGTLIDIDPLSEISVSIDTSQGYQQIGATVENRSIGGVSRTITGRILGKANDIKRRMLSLFTPFTSGKLIFNGEYYCDAVVKRTPDIEARDRDAKFTLMLYCAYPYWKRLEETNYVLGGYTPAFSFPVNYAAPHIFGVKNPNAFANFRNAGAVDALFTAEFTANASVTNYGITNVYTLQQLIINDTITTREKVRVFRKEGRLYVEKETESGTLDIFAALNEESDLFTLRPGDNVLAPVADSNGAENLIVSISFSAAYAGVFDGM